MFETIAELKVAYILMHMKGTPQTMMQQIRYEHIIPEMLYYFSARIARLESLGVNDIIINPGFGFSKSVAKSTGVEKAQVQQIVESFMESIKDSLTANKNVYLRGFGSFIVKKRAEKVARNISKNTTITIPAHNIPAFKPAKSFAGKVKANTK